ncbi:MAG: hypothetical protein JO250_02405 [Armatimonadetes bacterium]|nr:hypothetical protein [Armatimonadota bacterium]
MSNGRPKDKAPWLLTGCLALTLSGVSTLLPHTPAQAQPPKAATAGVTTHAAPVADDDGDGDELLEHWGDARYSREQRAQIKGLLALFAGAGALSYRRRAALRRSHRHG